ncbi:TPA: isochorismatase family protein [Pseudomonas aeruginosa]|uniref:isochorismatase family protein n=1 Tax=Pseudomonas aeruginosa TaxID=287 RepID=UPI002903C9EC|nr:isochorismatase family protein [Pseudomonas aeruginosa]MDU0704034.1 isochorismatase family protein [Pseudomonas aeruginosa]
MAVTAIDPNCALIVIDLQKGIVSLPAVHPLDGVVRNVAALGDVFRARGLPVVLVNVAGTPPGRTERQRPQLDLPSDWADLLPELNRQPQDHAVTKRTPGAFTDTGLEDHLKSAGVTQVVVVGVATSIGVEVTARQAYELGFNVTLAIDAMTDVEEDGHVWSVERVFPRISETGTTRDVIDLLERRA